MNLGVIIVNATSETGLQLHLCWGDEEEESRPNCATSVVVAEEEEEEERTAAAIGGRKCFAGKFLCCPLLSAAP
jgi:hypothetical protein